MSLFSIIAMIGLGAFFVFMIYLHLASTTGFSLDSFFVSFVDDDIDRSRLSIKPDADTHDKYGRNIKGDLNIKI